MNYVDPKALSFALSQIEDGFLFENFAKDFLSKILGYNFIPIGGVKDRGIDGLAHTFFREKFERNIYQLSIEKTCESKLENSLEKLKENKIKFQHFTYVTNQKFPQIDTAIDTYSEKYSVNIRIYDLNWFSAHVNDSEATIRAYHVFVESYLHEFQKPGSAYEVSDLTSDPRLFVFLRQQWDSEKHHLEIEKVLADTLILYVLEGTDPDKNIFKSNPEIKEAISKLVQFEPKSIYPLIDERLSVLSGRPRKIQWHTQKKAYCLPFETRQEIQRRNVDDKLSHYLFVERIEKRLKNALGQSDISVKNALKLMEDTINRLYHQQGLEFSNFVLHGENNDAFERKLPDIITGVVDSSSVITTNKESAKKALLVAIRDLVYNGTPEEKEFLRKLSHTYMMFFLLQCDPKLATYFGVMASTLRIYVCTSIIIPAMSEYFLETQNRRHWNLLKGAANAGVKLMINEDILKELASHFRMITKSYRDFYKDCEDEYLDETKLFYVHEIMLRAYFYSKLQNKVYSFDGFIDNFVSPDLTSVEGDLTEWLKTEFSIQYVSNASANIQVDSKEQEQLVKELKATKQNEARAITDARIALGIYSYREKNNENSSSGVFGFKTWWLSKDTVTQRAVTAVFRKKYSTSCYIRGDFLYNYISLSPRKEEINATYDQLFPSLVGISISSTLPTEVCAAVNRQIKEHKSKNPARVTSILRELSEKLKVDPHARTRNFIDSFFDERRKQIDSGI